MFAELQAHGHPKGRDDRGYQTKSIFNPCPRPIESQIDRGYQGFSFVILCGMARLHRLRVSERIFFVTVNLGKSLPPFTDAEYPLILASLDESRRRLGFLLCGYVLMPDHWHALMWPRDPLTISQAVRDVKSVSARRMNEHRQRRGAVWQHQFWDRFVRHANEYGQRLNYMHDNPVRKGLVAKPEEWRWSSFQNFSRNPMDRATCPIEIDYVTLPDDYRG